MKNLIQLLSLCLAAAAQAQGTFEAVTNQTSAINAQITGTAGWIFSPTVGIRVNALGLFQQSALGQDAVYLGLWTSSGTLLASNAVNVSSDLLNNSYYAPVPVVELVENQQYYLGAYAPAGPLFVDVYGLDAGDTILKSPVISLVGSANLPGGWGFPPADVEGQGVAYFGPNFTFTLIPEPSSLALLGAGAVLLLVRRRLN